MDGMSKEEKIGFHKGSLNTLIKERQELLRIIGIVEKLIQIHTASLKDLGVDTEEEIPAKPTVKEKKPIDEIL